MSEGLPNFNLNSFGGSSLQSFAGFGFNLGNIDPFNPNVLKPNNTLINSDPSMQSAQNKKGKGKKINKKKGKDLSVSISENGLQDTSEFGANDENSNSMGFDNQISKAPKQIRKQTLQRLQKKAHNQKPGNGFSGRNAERYPGSNTRRNKNFGPAKNGLNSGMFFKTKICPHFIEGNCRRGDACNYAHSHTELKGVPNLKKTRICQLFQIGKCNMGNSCSFAHGDQELRSTPEFFKTSLCHAFLKGTCKAGETCRYAHGDSELRSGPMMNNYSSNYSFGLNDNNNGFDINNNISIPQPLPQPQLQPQDPFNMQPVESYNNFSSVAPSNFGNYFNFGSVSFNPQPLTPQEQQPLPEIKFSSFNPDKLFNSNTNFYN